VGGRASGCARGQECARWRPKLATRWRYRGCGRAALEWRRASVAGGGGVCARKIARAGQNRMGSLFTMAGRSKLTELDAGMKSCGRWTPNRVSQFTTVTLDRSKLVWSTIA
jgi:hypothetical protein